jgi:hypothetical protein
MTKESLLIMRAREAVEAAVKDGAVKLAIPTVHLNGTSRDTLVEALCEAQAALDQAGRKLAAAAPNGRDFYPQGPGAINVAMDQHEARMRKLREIVLEIEQIAEAIP